jgi:aldose 1-epimerase
MESTLHLIESELNGMKTSASINAVGAALTGLVLGGHELIEKAPFESSKNFFYGVVMAPWSNRVRDGLWVNPEGVAQQLPINETSNNSALHGLVHDQEFNVIEKNEDSVVLALVISPTPGYLYEIELEVKYELTSEGLKVSHKAKNLSDEDAPFGIAYHPYLKFSPYKTRELTIVSGARTQAAQDNQQIPIGKKPTAGTSNDFSKGKSVEGPNLDEQLNDIPQDSNGERVTKLLAPNGSGIEIWQDASLEHLLIYTTDTYPAPDGEITALAIEPSSSAANAFNSGEDLIWLSPRETSAASWGIRLVNK